jgi:hypothetical protein
MLKTAKPAFSQLLNGDPGNKFDAKFVLAARREARRSQPFIPIQEFGLSVDEARNEWRPAQVERGALPLGEGG